MKRIDVAIAVICRQRNVLICRRRAKDRFGGCWEFPGGKVEAGETVQQALVREIREELDIQIEPLAALATIDHDYPDIHVRLHPFLCANVSGEVKFLGCEEAIWIEAERLRDYQFPSANDELIQNIMEYLRAEK